MSTLPTQQICCAPAPAEGAPALSRDAADLYRVLQDLVRVYTFRDRDRICCYDVSVSGCHAMDVLSRLGAISLNRLATELFVDKSTASRIVTSLEEKGYVRRVPDPEDRRALRLELTQEGGELHGRIRGELVHETEGLLATLDPEVRRGAIGLLRQLTRSAALRVGVTDASCCRIPEASPRALPTPAAEEDRREVLALLAASGLPTAGVEEQFPGRFVVARDPETGALAGVAGVEVYGSAGLLRSVAVHPGQRGTGLGQALTRAAAEVARGEGVRELYLLTTTAEGFFPRLGFERVERGELPATLGGSAELRGACPASAAAMRLRL